MEKLLQTYIQNEKLILSITTAIILTITFLIKKIKKRKAIKMNRTETMLLTPEEKELIKNKREEEKIKLQEEEATELKKIIKMFTPDIIELYNNIKNGLKRLYEKKEEYQYPEEINELLENERKELKEND